MDSDDEDMPGINAGRNLNSSTQPTQDLPSTSTNQPTQDSPSTPTPQTINLSPPPTLLLDYIVLKEVCENIFEDLKKLVKARNHPVHTEQYVEKWTALREMIDRVLCDLQRLYVEAQNHSLNNWLRKLSRVWKKWKSEETSYTYQTLHSS